MDEAEGYKDYKILADKLKTLGYDKYASMLVEMSNNEKKHCTNLLDMMQLELSKDSKSSIDLHDFFDYFNDKIRKSIE